MTGGDEAGARVPRLWRLAKLAHDDVRQRPVLLYPEGAVLLNDTGRAILDLVDGTRTIDAIAAILAARYGADVRADVIDYLDLLERQELLSYAQGPSAVG
ncbi:MAG: pyrroloquinoline quinone biosynthesis peptide chaperone PqqD [Gemmatimonadales bacterium]|nr:pyrroloquinoline quinone biosynthesis peptide chaperone PqqD [Gemmatimonadales bacterium]